MIEKSNQSDNYFVFSLISNLSGIDDFLKKKKWKHPLINKYTIAVAAQSGYMLFKKIKEINKKKRKSITLRRDKNKLFIPVLTYITSKKASFASGELKRLSDPSGISRDALTDNSNKVEIEEAKTQYEREINDTEVPEEFEEEISFEGVNILIKREIVEKELFSQILNFDYLTLTIPSKQAAKLTQFFREAVNYYIDNIKFTGSDLYISKSYGWSESELKIIRTFDSLYLDKKLKNTIISDVDLFLKNRELFTKKQIPYKRNYLFYGPPGTGKTSTVQAIGTYTKRDIHQLTLTPHIDSSDLLSLGMAIPENSIVFIEDFHTLMEGDKLREGLKVGFDGLLNFLDGINSARNCITIITTNKKEKIHPSVLRKGRIDREFYFDLPKPEQIIEMVENILEVTLTKEQKALITKNVKGINKPHSFYQNKLVEAPELNSFINSL